MSLVLNFLNSHPLAYVSIAGFAGLAAYRLWRGGALKGFKFPSFAAKSEPSLRGDLDSLLDILARAKKRSEADTVVPLECAVENLVREITA